MSSTLRVTVWNEYIHERKNKAVQALYPDGIHAVIVKALTVAGGVTVRTATQDEPEHGLTADVLAQTDVLMWWGHAGHNKVQDEVVARVQHRALEGMGLIVLHSGHLLKIFRRLIGTHCS